ncbi:MAG: hypothetical protein V4603_11870, partial [Pseudomonadota bacterium]
MQALVSRKPPAHSILFAVRTRGERRIKKSNQIKVEGCYMKPGCFDISTAVRSVACRAALLGMTVV